MYTDSPSASTHDYRFRITLRSSIPIWLRYGTRPSTLVASACTAAAVGAAAPLTTSLKPKKMVPFKTPIALPLCVGQQYNLTRGSFCCIIVLTT